MSDVDIVPMNKSCFQNNGTIIQEIREHPSGLICFSDIHRLWGLKASDMKSHKKEIVYYAASLQEMIST